jgi:hypothetical protein
MHSTVRVSAQASRVTKGKSRCRSVSLAMSFSHIANRQIGREKQSGISPTRQIGL